MWWVFPLSPVLAVCPPTPCHRSRSQQGGWGPDACHGKCTGRHGDGDSGLIQLTQRPSCVKKSPLVPKAPVCGGGGGGGVGGSGSGTAPSRHPLGTRWTCTSSGSAPALLVGNLGWDPEVWFQPALPALVVTAGV